MSDTHPTPPVPTPNDLPKAPAVEGQEPTQPEGQETQGEKTFTQADLDRIVSKRVGDLNQKLADLEAKLAPAEPAKPEVDADVAQALSEAQEALREAKASATQARLEASVTTAAIAAGVAPEKVGFVAKLADTASAVSEDGSVDVEAVKTAVATVLEGLPELAAPKAVGTGPTGTPVGKPMSWQEAVRKEMGIG